MILVYQVLAVALIIIGIANLYFVRDGYRKWRETPDSRLLRLLLTLKVMATICGLGLVYVSAVFLFGVRPVPGGGVVLVITAIVLVLIPGIIHLTMREIEGG